MNLPDDPAILYSILNMKLRDFYPSLEALCEDTETDCEELTARLLAAGYRYDSANNRIIAKETTEV